MRPFILGVTLGLLAGLAMRGVPADLGAGSLGGGLLPTLVAALLLSSAWAVLLRAGHRASHDRRALLLAVGSVPTAALLAAGPVMGLYFLLLPTAVLTGPALAIAARR